MRSKSPISWNIRQFLRVSFSFFKFESYVLKYKRVFMVSGSWNIRKFCFLKYNKFLVGFHFLKCKKGFLLRKYKKFLNMNYWTWTKTTPQKAIFLVKFLQNWGYDNFSYTNARVTKLWSHDHIHNIIWVMWQNFVSDVIDRMYDVITFISKYLYFKKGWGRHFCWHQQKFKYVYYSNL